MSVVYVEEKLTKKDYEDRFENELKKYRMQIEKLKVKSEEVKSELSQKWTEAYHFLEAKKCQFESKLVEFKNSGESAWSELVEDMEMANEELGRAFDKAVNVK